MRERSGAVAVLDEHDEGPVYRMAISKKALDLLCELLRSAGCDARWATIGSDEVVLDIRE